MEREDSAEKITSSPSSSEEDSTPKLQYEHQEKEVFPAKKMVNLSATETEGNTLNIQRSEEREENVVKKHMVDSPTSKKKEEDAINIQKYDHLVEDVIKKSMVNSPTAITNDRSALDIQNDGQGEEHAFKNNAVDYSTAKNDGGYISDLQKDHREKKDYSEKKIHNDQSHEKLRKEVQNEGKEESLENIRLSNITKVSFEVEHAKEFNNSSEKKGESVNLELEKSGGEKRPEQLVNKEEASKPIFNGTQVPDSEMQRSAWPEKAVAITNIVREKSFKAVSTVLRRLSFKGYNQLESPNEEDKTNSISSPKEITGVSKEEQEVAEKSEERPDVDTDVKAERRNVAIEELLEPIAMKGRILLYTRFGCEDCKEARLFLHRKRLRYVEINVEVYPSRKLELEKIAGSSVVPRVFFNEVLIGGLSDLKCLEETGKLEEKIKFVVAEQPSFKAPLPPLSGEDDASSSGTVDELATIFQKMKGSIVVRDRFCKMRIFTNCFLGSEAVDFLSEDQYLEREEAIELCRKLASKLFLVHVLDENLFEDGNHLYRFFDDDPLVSQCQNIPRGISEVKPKPIVDISSRLRFLSRAICEAYTSPDGRHVDYRSIHGSEEFARYLRIIEELQRVDLQDMSREENLAFFINLYNMMAIHAILVWGHPAGALDRRRLFGDFKYVIGGCMYSLSAIYNGILRGNQRPPYGLIRPFGMRDKQFKVALPYPEPLIHFALVSGHRSGPALRCYSPADVDKELVEAACNFLQNGGLIVDFNAKVAYISSILKWYSVDFGTNEVEVLKHAANYLKSSESQALLELLDGSQLKVVYQPYDCGLNH